MKKECCLGEKFFHFAHTILENREEIGLAEDDARKIRELKIKTKKDLILDTAGIEVAGVDILSRLWDEKVDLAEVEKLVDKKFDLKRESMKKLIRAFVTVKKILSRDQLKKLKSFCRAEKPAEGAEGQCCR